MHKMSLCFPDCHFIGDHYSMVTLLNDEVDVNVRGMIPFIIIIIEGRIQ